MNTLVKNPLYLRWRSERYGLKILRKVGNLHWCLIWMDSNVLVLSLQMLSQYYDFLRISMHSLLACPGITLKIIQNTMPFSDWKISKARPLIPSRHILMYSVSLSEINGGFWSCNHSFEGFAKVKGPCCRKRD